MRKLLSLYFLLSVSLSAVSQSKVSLRLMRGFPSAEQGISQGVSACFAGRIGRMLLMAGGCNFPGKPAAEGGEKRYYRGIYAARLSRNDTLCWHKVGELPVEAAYGVSVSADDGIVCAGGCNNHESLNTVLRIRLRKGRAVIDTLPSLPHPMDNFTGALQGGRLFVRGKDGLYTLNLHQLSHGWTREQAETMRLMQPVSGFSQGRYYVWGGYVAKDGNRPALLFLDGKRYGQTEVTVPAPVNSKGEKVFLGGACAVNIDADRVLVTGGVNKDIFLQALNSPQPGYLSHPVAWYRFNPDIFLFERGRWRMIGSHTVTARAGAVMVAAGKRVYLIGGELKPGIRTPDIYQITIH